MFTMNEIEVLKIVLKDKIPKKINKIKLKKLYVLNGVKLPTFYNHLFVLKAFEIIKEDKEDYIFDMDKEKDFR